VRCCRDASELVTDYLEGALAPGDRAWFETHVGMCPSCRRYLRQMRLTINVLHHLPRPALSDEAMDELLGAFRAWAGRPA
jgi:anti-sigma factor RsiW